MGNQTRKRGCFHRLNGQFHRHRDYQYKIIPAIPAKIMLQIKALIARDLYDMAQYFQIINDDNPSYQKALQIINNKETYNRLLGR